MAELEFRWGPFRSGDLPVLLGDEPPVPWPTPSIRQDASTEPAQLRWAAIGGKLVATIAIAAGKWDEINAYQLIVGSEICVDGLQFLARLPVFGYDTEIFEIGFKGACWVIDGRIPSNPVGCQLYDEETGKYQVQLMPWAQEYHASVYPVLEPIMPDMGALTGLYVSLMTPKGPAEARLLEVTAYDLAFVDYKGQLSDVWGQTKGETTFLNREAVVNIGLAG